MEKASSEYIKRFSLHRIIEHWLYALAFTILVVTGLSQKFHELDISQWIIITLGGIDATRIIHRFTGIFFTILTLQHIIAASVGILLLKWQPTMVIHEKDITDLRDNLRYYFGLKEHSARCDRYDYKQKFEYWCVVISGLFMIATGFMLWSPALAIKLFPGEFIPVAKVLHTNQSFLIFIIIAVWHIYNAMLSPEVFPIDTAMFTGKIPKERMIRKHPLEYERLFGVSLEGSGGKDMSKDKIAT